MCVYYIMTHLVNKLYHFFYFFMIYNNYWMCPHTICVFLYSNTFVSFDAGHYYTFINGVCW